MGRRGERVYNIYHRSASLLMTCSRDECPELLVCLEVSICLSSVTDMCQSVGTGPFFFFFLFFFFFFKKRNISREMMCDGKKKHRIEMLKHASLMPSPQNNLQKAPRATAKQLIIHQHTYNVSVLSSEFRSLQISSTTRSLPSNTTRVSNTWHGFLLISLIGVFALLHACLYI